MAESLLLGAIAHQMFKLFSQVILNFASVQLYQSSTGKDEPVLSLCQQWAPSVQAWIRSQPTKVQSFLLHYFFFMNID